MSYKNKTSDKKVWGFYFGYRMDAIWLQDGYRMDAIWLQDGYRMDTGWIQNGYRMDTQVRIGEVSIGKGR